MPESRVDSIQARVKSVETRLRREAEEVEEAATAEPLPGELTPENLEQIYRQAAARAKPPPMPRKLKPAEEMIALQRRWHLVYSDGNIPGELETLRKVIPSGLTPKEHRQLLIGSLEEAKIAFLHLINRSMTKRELWFLAAENGVEHALDGFEPKTRKSLEQVIKLHSD